MGMQPDKKTLDRLLALNDDQLRFLLRRLLGQYGLNAASIPLDQLDMGRLRQVVGQATDEDIARFFQLLDSGREGTDGRR
ncbi:MAG: hypothetical protein MJ192_04995 [Clostridia bacterium]|nr:hypothetical protein [Clostridia bacterium]